jgi:hypothetical protein
VKSICSELDSNLCVLELLQQAPFIRPFLVQ